MREGSLMIMLSVFLSAVLLALVVGKASAQGEPFGFTDASLDAFPPPTNAWADLVEGRAEVVDASTLRATIVVHVLPEMQPAMAYAFLFTAGTRDWYAVATMDPAMAYYYGPWGDGEPEESSDTVGSYTTGPDSIITIDVPISALGNVTSISHPRGLAVDFKSVFLPVSAGVLVLDEAEGTGTLALPARDGEAEVTTTASGATEDAAPAAVADAPATESSRETPMWGAAALVALAAVALLAPRRA